MKRTLKKLKGNKPGKIAKPSTVNSPDDMSLDYRRKFLEEKLGNSDDLVFRNIKVAEAKICIVYIANLVDQQKLNKFLLSPITALSSVTIDSLASTIPAPMLEIETNINVTVGGINGGSSLLLLDGAPEMLVVGTAAEDYRAIAEPTDELVVRGPHEGLIESLDKNIAMVRRKVRTDSFRMVDLTLGDYTGTRVGVCYIKGVAKDDVVDEVLKRLDQVDLDGILESGYLEEFIEDAPFSPFPTVGFTQKPDVVAGKMLEGRVAVFCDGTPVVLTVPFIFLEVFQTADDYYQRPIFPSIIRVVRLLAAFIAVLLPATYVAIVNFHPDFLPTKLLLTIAASSEGVPFPKVVEVLLMGLIFEILRESGLRIPTPMGQTISIVGALVLGDAAVRAGLVGPPVIIVTALTAISSFVIHISMSGPMVLFRLVFIFSAAFMGLLGVSFAFLGVVIHLCSLRSFGVNYLSPIAPLETTALKDTIVRIPWWMMLTRPRQISRKEKRRDKGKRPRQVSMDD
ncbi:spore germination protein [Metallumcola ferriviriculae]|uniref:Spore germination protein n=1 Tax=Metallumcola ferriviriculae TaxID=3039180 RepID=A0AAU0ULM2_9FIRM|nr:spore germination protein [Desulfitibacteraceae bacterium MK1]